MGKITNNIVLTALLVFILLPSQSAAMEKPDSLSAQNTWGISPVIGIPFFIKTGFQIHYTWHDKLTLLYEFTAKLPSMFSDELLPHHNILGIGYTLNNWGNVKIISSLNYIKYIYLVPVSLSSQENTYSRSNHLSFNVNIEFNENDFTFINKRMLFGKFFQRTSFYIQIGFITNIKGHPEEETYNALKTIFSPSHPFAYFDPWSISFGQKLEFPISKK